MEDDGKKLEIPSAKCGGRSVGKGEGEFVSEIGPPYRTRVAGKQHQSIIP